MKRHEIDINHSAFKWWCRLHKMMPSEENLEKYKEQILINKINDAENRNKDGKQSQYKD
jgi:hypothetical protein